LRLPQPLRSMLKFVWFNAEMTPNFREEHTENLKAGTVYGLCCTDSFGMVSSYLTVVFIHLSIENTQGR
jgi:hypothetical protein